MPKGLTMHKKRKDERLKKEVCHICGKAFFEAFTLKHHMDVYHSTGEQKYVCDKCGATYTSLHSLKGMWPMSSY